MDAIYLLSKEFKVVVVSRNAKPLNYLYPENVVIYRIGSPVDFGEYYIPLYKKIFDCLKFICKLRQELKRAEVSLLFCYDLLGFVAGCIASRFLPKKPIVYHQNETRLLSEIPKRRFLYWIKRLEICFLRSVDILSFPEPNRAKLFLKDANSNKDVTIIENCPPKLLQVPSMTQEMENLKLSGHRIVLHRGPIGMGNTIDIHEAIYSIKFWPSDAIFVILGLRTNEEEEACKKIIKQENLEGRVIFIPFVPTQNELLQYTASADVGLVLYKPIEVNRKYVAPCKLYDYLACGVPVIVPKSLPYLSEMVNRLGVGLSYFESTSEAIGKTICELLERPDRKKMGEKARQAHLSNLNFETQFAPLFEAIRNAI